jgi:hypothetical protein
MNVIKTDYNQAVYKTIGTKRNVQLSIMKEFDMLCCRDNLPDLRHTIPSNSPMPLIRFSFLSSERKLRPGNTENCLVSFDDSVQSLHLRREDEAVLDRQGGTQSRSRTLLEQHWQLSQQLSVPPGPTMSDDLTQTLEESSQTYGGQVFPSIEWSDDDDDDSVMLEEQSPSAFISRKRRRPRRSLVKCIKIWSDLHTLTMPPSSDTKSAPDEKRTRSS